MNHEDYINTFLEEKLRAFVTDLIKALEAVDGVSVYHTHTNGGDLRVRIGDNGRVIFTMYWQNRNEIFSCRCFVETNALVNYNTQEANNSLIEIKPTPAAEPLLSSFKFDPMKPYMISIIEGIVKKEFNH